MTHGNAVIDSMTSGGVSHETATGLLTQLVSGQSVMLATLNIFAVVAAGFVFSACLIWMAPKPRADRYERRALVCLVAVTPRSDQSGTGSPVRTGAAPFSLSTKVGPWNHWQAGSTPFKRSARQRRCHAVGCGHCHAHLCPDPCRMGRKALGCAGAAHATGELNRFVVWLALPALLFDIVAKAHWSEIWQPGFVAVCGLGMGWSSP
jgi:hypothetical protein